MMQFLKTLWAFGLALVLAACVMGGKDVDPKAPHPVLGSEIEVRALDEPQAVPTASAPAPNVNAASAPVSAAPAPQGAAAKPVTPPGAGGGASPAPQKPEVQAAKEGEAGLPPAVGAPAVAQPVKSASQLACEAKKGKWSKTASGYACVALTRDNGKSCAKASDCQSQCLARSGSCAPYQPLFGCNEVLDDLGRRMTLCLD